MPCGCMVFAFSMYSLFASSTYRFSFILSLFLRRRRNIKKNVYFQIRFIYSIQFKLVSFRGQKKVRPRPDWSPFGVRRACMFLACVAWRFCRSGRRSGEAARKIKTKFQVASAPISSRFVCPRPPLLLSAPNQNRHATQASMFPGSNP